MALDPNAELLYTSYQQGVPFNVTRLGGLTTTIIGAVGSGRDEDLLGIARGDSETWRKLPDAIAAQANFEVNRLRVLIAEKAETCTLIGGVVMGDQTFSRPLQQIVSRQLPSIRSVTGCCSRGRRSPTCWRLFGRRPPGTR